MGNLAGVAEGSFSTDTLGAQPNGTDVRYDYEEATKRLSTIVTESSTYHFAYDIFGNTSSIGVGDRTLASYTYHEGNGKLETLTYGNGDKVKYLYDALDRVKEICYNTGEDGAYETAYSYEYTASGALAKAHDHRAGETTAFAYGLAVGSPEGEFHAEWGDTVTIPYTQINVFDAFRTVYNRIMEW